MIFSSVSRVLNSKYQPNLLIVRRPILYFSTLELNMHCILDTQNNTRQGCLYLGNIYAANDPQNLELFGITGVLSVIDTSELSVGKNVKHKVKKVIKKQQKQWIMAEDCPEFDLSKFFDEATMFVSEQLSRGNVLVHCYAGISRSATIVIAYLMKYQKMRFSEANQKVRQIRRQVQPNDGFVVQLRKFEEKLQRARSSLSFNVTDPVQKTSVHSYLNESVQIGKSTTPKANSTILKQSNVTNDPILKYRKEKNIETLWYSSLQKKDCVKTPRLGSLKEQIQEFSSNNYYLSSDTKKPVRENLVIRSERLSFDNTFMNQFKKNTNTNMSESRRISDTFKSFKI